MHFLLFLKNSAATWATCKSETGILTVYLTSDDDDVVSDKHLADKVVFVLLDFLSRLLLEILSVTPPLLHLYYRIIGSL